MLALAAAVALAVQPGGLTPMPPGWTERRLSRTTAYEKNDQTVVVLDPQEATPFEAADTVKALAAALPDCDGIEAADVKAVSGGLIATVQDAAQSCGFLVMPLADGYVQSGILATTAPAVDEGTAFLEAVSVLRRSASQTLMGMIERGEIDVAALEARFASDADVPASLDEAAAAVPDANRPVHAVVDGYGTHVGWPPSYLYVVYPIWLFEGGRGHDCDGADPMRLDWDAIALSEDCDLYEWRQEGAKVLFREVGDESWESQTPDPADKLGSDVRLSADFTNRSGIGMDFGAGSIPVSTLSGKNLLLTPDGRITMTGYSDTLASGMGVVAYASGETPPIQGRYRIDGNVITMLHDGADRPIHAYVATVNDSETGEVGHIYLGGTHYWDRD